MAILKISFRKYASKEQAQGYFLKESQASRASEKDDLKFLYNPYKSYTTIKTIQNPIYGDCYCI